jgi:hypothetical protein
MSAGFTRAETDTVIGIIGRHRETALKIAAAVDHL